MMKRLLTLSLVILLYAGCTQEGDLQPTEVETYIKLKGDPDFALEAVDAIATDDGGAVLLANAINLNDESSILPKIMKVDKYGITEWEFILNNQQYSYQLTELSSGSNEFILAGERDNSMSLIYFNANNEVENQHIVPFCLRAKSSIVSNNELKVIGEKSSNENSVTPVIFSFVTDPSFTAIGDTILIDGDRINIENDVFTNSNSSLLFASNMATNNKAQITGWSPNTLGAGLDKAYPSEDVNFITSSFYLDENTSNGNQNCAVIGNVLSTFAISYGDASDENTFTGYSEVKPSCLASSITKVKNASGYIGSYLIGGSLTTSNEEDFWIAFVDFGGGIQKEKTYGGQNADYLKIALEVEDGILLFGDTEYGDVTTLMLIKTDMEGEL